MDLVIHMTGAPDLILLDNKDLRLGKQDLVNPFAPARAIRKTATPSDFTVGDKIMISTDWRF